MLTFETKMLSFKFDGEEYEIAYPTLKKIGDFRKKLKAEDSDEVDCTIDFLCDLGAKKSVIEALRVAQLNQLVDELTLEKLASKKN